MDTVYLRAEDAPKFSVEEIRKAHNELKVFNRTSTQQIDNLADFITKDRTVYYADDYIYAVELKEG